jgi:hypothetical protein
MYARAMRRDEGEAERLRVLVGGAGYRLDEAVLDGLGVRDQAASNSQAAANLGSLRRPH